AWTHPPAPDRPEGGKRRSLAGTGPQDPSRRRPPRSRADPSLQQSDARPRRSPPQFRLARLPALSLTVLPAAGGMLHQTITNREIVEASLEERANRIVRRADDR